MTGYGYAVLDTADALVSVEIKSLNSKFFDVQMKTPKLFSEKEAELRNILSERLDRGKVTLNIEFHKKTNATPKININKSLFSAYYSQYKEMAEEAQAPQAELFKLALQSPDVVSPDISEAKGSEEDYLLVKDALLTALDECDAFRIKEGETLHHKIKEYADNIGRLLVQVKTFEPERMESVKARLRNSLGELLNDNEYNKDRFEQELIYYIEKLDIQEELVRLSSHLEFFLRVMDGDSSHGKKLGFISQEIGREINTIGSKANHAGIQRIVVQMKDELEKIKEQLQNVL